MSVTLIVIRDSGFVQSHIFLFNNARKRQNLKQYLEVVLYGDMQKQKICAQYSITCHLKNSSQQPHLVTINEVTKISDKVCYNRQYFLCQKRILTYSQLSNHYVKFSSNQCLQQFVIQDVTCTFMFVIHDAILGIKLNPHMNNVCWEPSFLVKTQQYTMQCMQTSNQSIFIQEDVFVICMYYQSVLGVCGLLVQELWGYEGYIKCCWQRFYWQTVNLRR
eukprot:TRINITY_DN2148_c1_g1_i1.p5 TRINITY_DN2148_c1_g1~~TRINITY_DN2148_c1_g1_i1.p5  ORF type:complete len:219 (-),score=-14.02 TRINITY_DN2148_c1_g1_i1:253-909(-)